MTAPRCEHCCHAPSYKAVEQQQQPCRGLWQAIVARIADMSPDVPIYRRELDRLIIGLWNEQPDAAATFALNTTRHDRAPDEQAA